MLAVKVEIWPYGSQEHKYEIGRLSAANISDCAPVSSYTIGLSDRQGQADGVPAVIFQLDGHRRSDGFWALIHGALTMAGSDGLIPGFDTGSGE